MEIPAQLKRAVLAVAVMAMPLRHLAAQDEAELQDSGLRFTIRNVTLAHEGTQVVFRAILDNRTKQDWYMRSATVTANAACKNGPRHLDFRVHFTNPDLKREDLILGQYATGYSIKPGQNDIAESVRADPTCRFDSLGSVSFKTLHPVDAATQQKLDAHREYEEALNRLNAASDTFDAIRAKDAAQRRIFCLNLMAAMASKKVSDLTVKEAQDVRTCQEAGYH